MSKPIYQIWNSDNYPSYWDDIPFEEYQRVKNPDDKRVLYESEDSQSELAAKDKEIEGYKESLSIAYEAERKLRDELQVLKAQRK